MNYQKIYEDLISKARSENRKKLKRNDQNYVYYEKHHIIPRCLGGLNNVENLVLLTAKEHFVAHKILVEIYPKAKGLICALWLMCKCGDKNIHQKIYKVSSREYNYSRMLYIDVLRERNIGQKRSQEWKDNISKAAKFKKFVKCPHCNFISKNRGIMNLFHFDNCKLAKNPDLSVRVKSIETRLKMSNSNKSKQKIECPWCHKMANIGNAKQCHFDRCKFNPERVKRVYKCIYCDCETESKGNITRWHNENCKYKISN